MSVIYIVLPLALLMAGLGVAAFIWSVRHGQLDDLQTPALRMLHDDSEPAPKAAIPKETLPRESRRGA